VVLAAVFSISNMILFQSNRSAQIEASGRQQYIQQSIQLQVLYNEMVRALADLAMRNQDADLITLLKSQGMSFSGSPGAAPPANATQGSK
jgi:hypothetical protein